MRFWMCASGCGRSPMWLLDKVSNVGKTCATGDIRVLNFMEPAHTEIFCAPSLTAHVECLQVVQVCLGRGSCLGRIEQHWRNEGHVQTQLSCQEEMWLAPDAFYVVHIFSCSPNAEKLLRFRAICRVDGAAKVNEALLCTPSAV